MLNDSQKIVVEHGNGPLLVISGAGTGKTHVLTQRLLNLIENQKVSPESILALTFTEKATQEVADRVEQHIPYASTKIVIRTFHSFCDLVLREYAVHIGLTSEYKILQEADLLHFLKDHYADFKLDYFATRAQPYRILTTLQSYFSRLQEEDITPNSYLIVAKEKTAAASNEEEIEYAKKHSELALAYTIYLELMVRNGYMDFAGLQYHTLRLLEERPSILAKLQKRFSHILVDEFQDTNFAQMKLVLSLSASHKNIVVVGDDDQSIYKWRGASLSNAQRFSEAFPGHETAALTMNYRSTQAILDAAYAVIQQNNPHRLEVTHHINKHLESQTMHGENELPQIHHFQRANDERDFIIERSISSVEQGNSVAILCRTNSLATQYIHDLQAKDAPISYNSYNAFFNTTGVKDIMALLRFLADPKDDMALMRLLYVSHWEIPQKILLQYMGEVQRKQVSLLEILATSDFAGVVEVLNSLIEETRTKSVSEMIGVFFDKTNYVSSLEKSGNTEGLEAIGTFSERIRLFEETHADNSTYAFIQYSTLVEEMGAQSEGISAAKDGTATIHIITIHGSKGLEFDTVFIPALVQNKFPAIRRSEPIEIPESLLREQPPEGDTHIEEERRLFYVACTRAKKHLTLTYSDNYESTRNYKVSPFVSEMLTAQKATYHHHTSSDSQHTQKSLFNEHMFPELAELKLSSLSYSQITTFEACPLKYQFRYLFHLPQAPNASLSFGISVHNALRDFYAELKKHPEHLDSDMQPLIDQFLDKNWINAGYASRAIQLQEKENARKALHKYYKKNHDTASVTHAIEASFKFKLNGITISGRIDRIDKLTDGTYEIIDYKTGSADHYRVNTDMQLSLYALAAQKSLHIEVSKLSLHFVETGEILTTTRNEKQLAKCEESILETAEEIKTGQFVPKPGYQCGSCDFRLICPAAMAVLR